MERSSRSRSMCTNEGLIRQTPHAGGADGDVGAIPGPDPDAGPSGYRKHS